MSVELETNADEKGEGLLPPALERSMPEDAAEYMLFAVDDGPAKTSTTSSRAAASSSRARLNQIRKAALKLSEDLTKEYIWQRDSFNLEVVSRNSESGNISWEPDAEHVLIFRPFVSPRSDYIWGLC